MPRRTRRVGDARRAECAGQPAIYVAMQLKAYRDGTRRHEVMSLMAKPLSDADIHNLAAWYAALKIEVKPVP